MQTLPIAKLVLSLERSISKTTERDEVCRGVRKHEKCCYYWWRRLFRTFECAVTNDVFVIPGAVARLMFFTGAAIWRRPLPAYLLIRTTTSVSSNKHL